MRWMPCFVIPDVFSTPSHHTLCLGRLQWSPLLPGFSSDSQGRPSEGSKRPKDWFPHLYPCEVTSRWQIPQSKVTVPLKTPLSTFLSSSGFQQSHPFHILWATDSNNPTVTSIGTIHPPHGFPKPSLIFVKMPLLKPSSYSNLNVSFASCWDSFATSNMILRFWSWVAVKIGDIISWDNEYSKTSRFKCGKKNMLNLLYDNCGSSTERGWQQLHK